MVRSAEGLEDVEFSGVMFVSFAGACLNLSYVLGHEAEELLAGVDEYGWYPCERYYRLIDLVTRAYTDPLPILERIGMDTARTWYEQFGKTVMARGVDFLTVQGAGHGYRRVVRGPEHKLGKVVIRYLNEAEGRAVVHSTTLTPRPFQRGVFLGALQIPGDLTFVQVDNSKDPDIFEIEFH